MTFRFFLFVFVLSFVGDRSSAQKFEEVEMVPEKEATGNRFKVKYSNGSTEVVRLYGIECPMIGVKTGSEMEAVKLWRQRLQFGGSSVEIFRRAGVLARRCALNKASGKFTLVKGDNIGLGYQVPAVSIDINGEDMAELLVKTGWALPSLESFPHPDGRSPTDVHQNLKKIIPKKKIGIWSLVKDLSLKSNSEVLENHLKEVKLVMNREFPLIDLNEATLFELQFLRGVGPATAGRIVTFRSVPGQQFTNWKDLSEIDGISEYGAKGMSQYLVFSNLLTFEIEFAINKSVIRDDAEFELLKVYERLILYPEVKAQIQGHFTKSGTAEKNQELRAARAEAVKKKLLEMGISKERLLIDNEIPSIGEPKAVIKVSSFKD